MNSGPQDSLKKQLYYQLLYLRRAEERVASDYAAHQMKFPLHLYVGHEAIASGVCALLKREDLVFPYYRCHGWYLAKGGDLNKMVAELHGKEGGCSKGLGGSMHLIDLDAGVMGSSAIVAGMISHAVGAALSLRFQGKSGICVVSFGDGATEEGVFYESLNFAALKKLPVIFVCENNLYAANTPGKQTRAQSEIYQHAASAGMHGERVDGNDVLAVYEAAQRAVERARSGQGPTLLECMTYRRLEHCGPNEDHHQGIRSPREGDEWRSKDPLVKARDFVSADEVRSMEEKISGLLDEAFEFAYASPAPQQLIVEDYRS